MTAIIISGHGHFATGISSALDLIMGRPEKYLAIDFPYGSSAVELETLMDDAIKNFGNDDIIILVDLFGGTPFNTAMKKVLENNRIQLFYGLNLGMLLELISRLQNSDDKADILDGIEDTGKLQIGKFHPEDMQDECDESEEETL